MTVEQSNHSIPPPRGRSRRLSLLAPLSALILGAGAAACSPAEPAASVGATGGEALQLPAGPPESPTTLAGLGAERVQLAPSGAPLYLSGQLAGPVRDGASAAEAVLRNLRSTYRLSADSGLSPLSSSRDDSGRIYYKLGQSYRGIPVAHREIVVEAGLDGTVGAVLGELVPELRISDSAFASRLSGDEAVGRALASLVKAGEAKVHSVPELVVFAADEHLAAGKAPTLAYRALVEYEGEEGRALEELYADAAGGAVLARYTQQFDALSRGVYDYKGGCLGLGGALPGTALRSEGGAASTDAAANNVYEHGATTYWYYKHFLGRDSFDNKGAALTFTVHVTFLSGFSCSPNNAAWTGPPYNQMVYGDGDNMVLKDLTKSLDVTAHELTHAVTNVTSNLVYQNESGALNEAMSDIFGSSAAAWKMAGGGEAGNPASITPTADIWKIGKEVAGPKLAGGALRFMDNPTADGVSKDYYPERVPDGGTDRGGVHLNSGLGNLVFHLLSVGGKHPRDKVAGSVSGIGIAKAMRIFYLTNTSLLTSSAKFEDARYATARAAENLYGRCSTEWLTVLRAWDLVGVPGSWMPCNRPPGHF